MKLPRKYGRLLMSLLCLFLFVRAGGQTVSYCDSVIAVAVKAMWKKDHVHSLELLTEARSIAEKNRWYKQQFLALNNIGANYYTMLDYGEALNYYLQSYTLAVKHLEPVNEMVVLNNIAILYGKEKKYNEAEEYFGKAYNIAKENKDSLKVGLYAMNLGLVANETNRLTVARNYIAESLPLLKREPEMFFLAEAAMADNMLRLGQTAAARQKAETVLKKVDNFDFNELGLTLMTVVAKSYKAEKKYGAAIAEMKKILSTKPGLDVKKDLYGMLAEVYGETKDYQAALAWKDSVTAAVIELNNVKNGELYQTNRVKFEIQDYKNQLSINNQKLQSERKLFYYVGAVGIALLVIILLVMRNISVKNRQKQLLAERNEKEMALELELEKNEKLLLSRQIAEKEAAALLEQERLKNEIESRNRKLSARALYLSGRNELIEEVIESLSQSPALSQNSVLSQQVRSLKGHLKNNDDWDSFLTHFEEVNHGLLEKLKAAHPSLTANDLRFIAYIYMNLSTKEIASLLNITPEACRKRKERLATKMELPASTSLFDYLSYI